LEKERAMRHVVLLGDSILDNGAYVRTGGEVVAKLRAKLASGDAATLLARDGAVIEGVHQQLRALPGDATDLVVSAGGNDALRSTGVLMEPAGSVAAALGKILVVRDRFAQLYGALLDAVEATGREAIICTIYDVWLPEAEQRRVANLALGVLNDVITREAARRRLPLIDLRVMLTQQEHFANAIEPSEMGSEVIAAGIVASLAHDHAGPSAIYVGDARGV
jgi:hypothetical protein